MTTELGRVVMVVPTYNEVDNLEWIVGRLRANQPDVDVLVVDDGSPDGTGALADRLATTDAGVHVLHRDQKAGLGAAYLAGFAWSLDAGRVAPARAAGPVAHGARRRRPGDRVPMGAGRLGPQLAAAP
jgi:glycosyltransferase involved in cell wall biosynthesis